MYPVPAPPLNIFFLYCKHDSDVSTRNPLSHTVAIILIINSYICQRVNEKKTILIFRFSEHNVVLNKVWKQKCLLIVK